MPARHVRYPAALMPAALMLAAWLCFGTAGTMAATVVETQRIIVDPTKPLDGQPPAVTPDASKGPELHRPGEEQLLPAPVAAIRKKILDACYSGDIEKLRAVIKSTTPPPALSVNEIDDPIEYLKGQSGDGGGLEILAILADVLEAGWAHVDAGTPQDLYVFPYYAVLPMNKLTPPQLVDIYKIVTSGDFEEMKASGTYGFYAVGIAPDGTWRYFKPND